MLDSLKYNFYFRKYFMLLLNSFFLNNNLIYRYLLKKRIYKYDKYCKQPPEIALELTNHCNSNCTFCTRNEMKRKKGFISKSLYKKIIKDMAENNYKYLNLTGFGESLIDRNLIFYIDYAISNKLYVKLITNGSLITEDISLLLLDSGINEIIVSLDTINEIKYNELRKNLNYQTVYENLNNIIKLKKEKKSNVKIIIQTTLIKPDFSDIKELYVHFKKKVDYIIFQSAFNWGGSMNEYIGPFCNREISDLIPCQLLWKNMVIRWNGEVSLCCADFDSKYVLGDLNSQTLNEVWYGKKLKNYRRLHINNQKKSIKICNECNLFPVWW